MDDVKLSNEVKQYLSFELGEELFAFDVLKIKEVIEYPKITKIPNTPNFMEGIINLRGSGVPVIDLRVKFGMEKIDTTVNTSIIIVEVDDEEEGIMLIGARVDAVHEVVKFESTQLERAPKIGMSVNSNFISSMGKVGEDFVIILNMEKIFSEKELAYIQESSVDAEAVAE